MLWVIVVHMVVFSSLHHFSFFPLSTFLLCPTSFIFIVIPVLFFRFPQFSLFLYSHFLSFPLVFPLHIFLSSCKPFMSSPAQDELRYKVLDACLCGTSLLIVFPPHLSLYPQPPEYIKILYLFYLYVNAPSHSFPLFSCTESASICSQFLSLQLISPGMLCGKSHNSVETEQIMLFYDHTNSPHSSLLLIRFQHVVF